MSDLRPASRRAGDRVVAGVALAVAVVAIGAMVWRREILATSGWAMVLQGMAGALMIWGRLTFGLRSLHMSPEPTPGGLVTNGPFRYLRHPLYASLLWWVWAAAGSHPSWTGAGLAFMVTVSFWLRMRAEERELLG